MRQTKDRRNAAVVLMPFNLKRHTHALCMKSMASTPVKSRCDTPEASTTTAYLCT